MYLTHLVLLGLAIISNSILIIILYRYCYRASALICFIVFLIFINIWIAPKFFTNLFHAQGILFETLSRIAALGYVFVPVIFLVFALTYATRYSILHRMTFWALLLLPAIAFLYLSWTTNLVGIHSYSEATLYDWGYETPAGKLYPLFIFWFETIMILGISILIYYYKTVHDDIKRKQTLFVIIAIIFPFIVGSFTNAILPILNIFIFPMGVLLTSAMAAIIVYTLFKYGLFEVTPMSVLSGLQHALITVDNKGNIVQMNSFSERLFAKRADNLIGMSIDQLLYIHPREKPRNQAIHLLQQVLDKGKSISLDRYILLSKKRHSPFTVSITPVYSGRNIVAANILLRDIKKEREREKQKDDYISMISHELKTPITSIKAYNQILLKQLDASDRKYQIVSKMDNQVDRLQRLIQDFFELSRIQLGKLKLEKEFIEFDEFIQEVIDSIVIAHKNRNISMHGSTNSTIFADKDRLTQVIINLVNNALKYSPEDKDVEIKLFGDNKKILVGVKDYGKGIPREYQKKIFDRFYQIEHTPNKTMGLGIGLYLSHTIIKAHGGKLWVESEETRKSLPAGRQGSTFYFTLPISN